MTDNPKPVLRERIIEMVGDYLHKEFLTREEFADAILQAFLEELPEEVKQQISPTGLFCGTPHGAGWNDCRTEILRRMGEN